MIDREKLIEAMARARCPKDMADEWAECDSNGKGIRRFWQIYVPEIELELDQWCVMIPGLSDLLDDKAVIVPLEPTEVMHDAAYMVDCWFTNRRDNAKRYAAMLAVGPYRSKSDD